MNAPCEACGWADTVEYDGDTCLCDACGARYEIDEDADWTGDHYQDTSGPGKRLNPELKLEHGADCPCFGCGRIRSAPNTNPESTMPHGDYCPCVECTVAREDEAYRD